MVERGICGDSAHPGAEVSVGTESCVGAVDSPKGFHGQVLRGPRVANDADNPAIHLALELPEQRFERFQVTPREPFQQFHEPSSIRSYWVRVIKVSSIPANQRGVVRLQERRNQAWRRGCLPKLQSRT